MNCPVCEVFKQVVDAGQQDPFLVHKRLLAELPTVFNSLAKADLFPRFLDGLLGAQKLLHDANVPEEFARAALKSAIKAFTDFVTEKETTDEGKQFVAGAAEQLSSIPASQMGDVVDIYFQMEKPAEFAQTFRSPIVNRRVVEFLKEKLPIREHTGDVLKWIKALPIQDSFDASQLTAHCLANHECNHLFDLCRADRTFLHGCLDFLNSLCGDRFEEFDPDAAQPIGGYTALNQKLQQPGIFKTVVKVAIKLFNEFDADPALVANCVFTRQMNQLVRAFRDFDKDPYPGRRLIFDQSVALALSKGARLQQCVLAFIAKHRSDRDAFYYALINDVPAERWPDSVRRQADDPNFYNSVQQKVQVRRKNMEAERSQLDEGLLLYRSQEHRVFMVDSVEKVHSLLTPFLTEEDPAHDWLGFDAEWDPSDCGRQGTLCLVQLSHKHRTLLLDMTRLGALLDRPGLVRLFQAIFDGPKRVVGFDFGSDLGVLRSNFPFLNDQVPGLLTNVVCLMKATAVLNLDPTLLAGLVNTPGGQLPGNLGALSKELLGKELSKSEQSSVWSARPLRLQQVVYAAQDSYVVYRLYEVLHAKLSEGFSARLPDVFRTMDQLKEEDAAAGLDIDRSAPTSTRRTKSSHFTADDLHLLVKRVNAYFESAGVQTEEPGQFEFLADTMCTQLGVCLRRLGISTFKFEEKRMGYFTTRRQQLTVLTTGKAANKFGIFPHILDMKSSAETLDYQLEFLLKQLRIRVRPEQVRPRCADCNLDRLAWLPPVFLKCLHFRQVLRHADKYKHLSVEEQDLDECERELRDFASPFLNCFASECFTPQGRVFLLRNAVVDLNQQTIREVEMLQTGRRYRTARPLKLATHRDLRTCADQVSLRAICVGCGSENADLLRHPSSF